MQMPFCSLMRYTVSVNHSRILFLGAVEKGIITLIGATTENPSFEVISALLSRCQVYTLQHHSKDELIYLMKRAIEKDTILKTKKLI